MKILFITSIIILIGYSVFSQTHLYENPKFDEIAKNHQIIGIIPFKASVTLRPKQMKDITPEQLNRMEKSEEKNKVIVEEKICKCKYYTLEEIFYLNMNVRKCPRCKKVINS